MQKGFALVSVLVGVLIIVAAVGGAFYLGRVSTPKPQPQNPVITSSPQSSLSVDETANWETFKQGWIKELKYPLDKYSLLWPDETYIGGLYNSRSLLFQPIGVTLKPNDQYAKQNLENPPYTLSIFVFNNKDNLALFNAKDLSERYGYISPVYLGFDKGVTAKETSVDGLSGIRLDVDCNGEGCSPGSEIFVIKILDQPSGAISSVIFRFTIVPPLKDSNKNKQVIENILGSIKFGP
ncbi:hypothetical protein HYS91_01435 [Candidatus Daviesbacteria bacterium]|nr:hypothetical protein [Candidatus Daviesbacteria bacterium]